jgi:hypothetical protein
MQFRLANESFDRKAQDLVQTIPEFIYSTPTAPSIPSTRTGAWVDYSVMVRLGCTGRCTKTLHVLTVPMQERHESETGTGETVLETEAGLEQSLDEA